MLTEIPALLLNKEARRKMAKKEVRTAIQNIKSYGALAGISDRSLYEFLALSKFMENELIKEKFPV